MKQKELAYNFYEKAIVFDELDFETMIEYASILETINPHKALSCKTKHIILISFFSVYLSCVKAIQTINHNNQDCEQNIFLQPEILLNIATLKHKIGKRNT